MLFLLVVRGNLLNKLPQCALIGVDIAGLGIAPAMSSTSIVISELSRELRVEAYSAPFWVEVVLQVVVGATPPAIEQPMAADVEGDRLNLVLEESSV